MRKAWHLWAKAIGTKEGCTNREADIIALIRTFIILVVLITNIMDATGIVRH